MGTPFGGAWCRGETGAAGRGSTAEPAYPRGRGAQYSGVAVVRPTWDACRIASRVHDRHDISPGDPAGQRAAPAPVPPHVATALDFQRSLGNRATAAILA